MAKDILNAIADIMLPRLCPLCNTDLNGGTDDLGLCLECTAAITLISPPFCELCGKPFSSRRGPDERLCGDCLTITPKRAYISARSTALFDGTMVECVHRLKYNSIFSLTTPMATLLSRVAQEYTDHTVMPVPLHTRRLRKRKFNQSLLLARALAKKLSLAVDYKSLVKTRDTRPQVGLTMRQREENVKGAFALAPDSELSGKRILLIDDVYTTGATISECAKALKKGGAEVRALTLARAVSL